MGLLRATTASTFTGTAMVAVKTVSLSVVVVGVGSSVVAWFIHRWLQCRQYWWCPGPGRRIRLSIRDHLTSDYFRTNTSPSSTATAAGTVSSTSATAANTAMVATTVPSNSELAATGSAEVNGNPSQSSKLNSSRRGSKYVGASGEHIASSRSSYLFGRLVDKVHWVQPVLDRLSEWVFYILHRLGFSNRFSSNDAIRSFDIYYYWNRVRSSRRNEASDGTTAGPIF
jgi:hypothetical protein